MSRIERLLLVPIAVLSVFLALFDPWKAAQDRMTSAYLVARGGGEVVEIQLQEPSGESIAVQKGEGGSWALGVGRPIATTRVRNVIEALRLVRVLREAEPASAHGLGEEAPTLTIRRQGAKSPERFAIGALAADKTKQWVRRTASSGALLVESHLVRDVVSQLRSLAEGPLAPWAVAPSSEPLRLEGDDETWLVWDAPWVRFGRADGTEHALYADPERLHRWLASLAALAPSRAASCTSPPSLRLTRGEHALKLSSVDCLATPVLQEVLAVWNDPTQLASMALFKEPKPTEEFRVECSDQAALQVRPNEVDTRALEAWWSEVRHLPTALVPTAPVPIRDPAIVCDITGGGWKVRLWNASDGLRGTSPHRDYDFLLAPEAADAFTALAARFRDPTLVAEDAVFLRELEWQAGENRRVWQRDPETRRWRRGGAVQPRDRQDELDRAARALASLTAVAFGPATGGQRAVARLSFVFESALSEDEREYALEIFGGPTDCWVRTGEAWRARLSPEDCSAIWLGRR